MILIDSDVAIHWRDGDPSVTARIAGLDRKPSISAISRAELENGVYRDRRETEARRARVDLMLARLAIIDFTDATAAVFGSIVDALGYSRPQTNDRMIAATALLHGATLITMNGRHFRSVPGLKLEVWE